MGRLIYLMNVSLDGYVETVDHGLDWTVIDEELTRGSTTGSGPPKRRSTAGACTRS